MNNNVLNKRVMHVINLLKGKCVLYIQIPNLSYEYIYEYFKTINMVKIKVEHIKWLEKPKSSGNIFFLT